MAMPQTRFQMPTETSNLSFGTMPQPEGPSVLWVESVNRYAFQKWSAHYEEWIPFGVSACHVLCFHRKREVVLALSKIRAQPGSLRYTFNTCALARRYEGDKDTPVGLYWWFDRVIVHPSSCHFQNGTYSGETSLAA